MPGFDISEKITVDLAVPIATAYLPSDAAWDVAIGGLPFNMALDKERPMQRETAPFRHDRVDQARDPGEQSLDSGMWLRSFSSLHYGAGQRAVEPLEVDPAVARFRFYRSASVDPWTPGKITTSQSVSTLRSNAATAQQVIGVSATTCLHSTDTTLSSVTNVGGVTAVTWGGSVSPITSLTTDGTSYWAANNVAIYKGALPAGAGAVVYNTTASTVARFVKSRLMAGVGPSLYELTAAGPALPTALFTHPSSGWLWTDIEEGPSGIYYSGYSAVTSGIYRSGITISGSTVTAAAPVLMASMPRGEIVNTLYAYLGTYLIIGTSKGLRVASFNTDGSLNVGPLIFTAAGGVLDAVGYDKYVYATGGSDTTSLDGATGSGLYRVDLSVEVESLRFAYAQECAITSASAPSSVSIMDAQVVYTVSGTGLVAQSATPVYATDAWIEYGKVTFSTTEAKAWRSLLLRADCPTGSAVQVFASTTGTGNPSTWVSLGSYSGSGGDGEFSLSPAAPAGTRELYIALRLTGTASVRPVVTGVTIRAVPAPKRTRLVSVPLLCFDHEKDRNGVMRGYKGGAWARLSALESLEDSGSLVTWQDFTTGERRTAVLEQVNWSRVTPPSRGVMNSGGVVTALLRVL